MTCLCVYGGGGGCGLVKEKLNFVTEKRNVVPYKWGVLFSVWIPSVKGALKLLPQP